MDHSLRSLRGVVALGLIAVLGGCAAEGKAGGDPGARPLPPGMTCQTVRQELNALDSKGAPAKVEAVSSGRKVSEADKATAARYNQLLNYYLGGRCHV
ncbi:MAG: hypothetical protein SFW09_14440 [Hyphomicrobiaceae bacterium]|nr:hypothetical protein [Hyphomicrobiaceae bacterium]